jgi:excinuclease ABC subunit B
MDIGDDDAHPASGKVKLRKVAEKEKKYKAMTATDIMGKISELEQQMFEAARELEFEKAASIRDEIEHLRAEAVKIS